MALNAYRVIGDASHVIAIIILFIKIFRTKSVSGISGKSIALFALTYTARYIDLYMYFISSYNTAFKVFYLFSMYFLTYLTIYGKKDTYQKEHDRFPLVLLLIPVTICSLAINHELSFIEVAWTWSIYMEAVAILPQIFLLWLAGNVDWYMIAYVTSMGLYRGLYIGNWAYRYYYEGYYDKIAIAGGIIEASVASLGLLIILGLKIWNIRYGKEEEVEVDATYKGETTPEKKNPNGISFINI